MFPLNDGIVVVRISSGKDIGALSDMACNTLSTFKPNLCCSNFSDTDTRDIAGLRTAWVCPYPETRARSPTALPDFQSSLPSKTDDCGSTAYMTVRLPL